MDERLILAAAASPLSPRFGTSADSQHSAVQVFRIGRILYHHAIVAMSLTVVGVENPWKTHVVDEAQHASSTNKSLLKHFGTTACALGRESKRSFEADLQLKKEAMPIRMRHGAKAVR